MVKRHREVVMAEDEEVVVKEVMRQGGLEYVRLAAQAAEGDEFAADVAHEMAWEQLHCAPWHAVHPAWRDAYSLSCLRLAAHRAHDALRLLDMGLLMGGPLLKPRLLSTIARVQHTLSRQGNNAISLQDASDAGGDADLDFGGGHDAADDVDVENDDPEHGDTDDSQPCLRSTFDGNQKTAHNQVAATKLPHDSLCCQKVSRKNLIPVEDFLCNYFIPTLPVIIMDGMTHWPATKKWKNLDYFRDALGCRTVPVEVGEHYLAPGWKQELMTMSELLKRFQIPATYARPYLAQHPLFEQIPKLREDILVPDYCAATGGELQTINAWFGPSGTVTPLHHDPHHNLLSQVIGRKYVRLYSPVESDRLYPYKESMLSNSSQVDLDNPDYMKFPLAENLPFLDCILEEGEMLYIPPKWWHYVRSLSLSFSVSFWWSDMDSD